MRELSTPRVARYSLAVLARRSPRARLYCSVPRSSECPSMRRLYCGWALSQVAAIIPETAACFRLLGLVRILVLTIQRVLQDVASVGAHPKVLPVAAAVGLEVDQLSVQRPGRLLVRALTGQDAALSRHEISDA